MRINALLFFWRQAPARWKLISVAAIAARTVRTIGAWTVKPEYRDESFKERRSANIRALRDFIFRRYGRATI